MTNIPRPYQVAATNAAIQKLNRDGSTLVVMATGLGKSTVIAEVIRELNLRTVVLAHRRELVDQLESTINRQLGTRVGVDMASRHSNGERVVVGSIQTYAARGVDRLGPRDLVVIDEAHHAVSSTYLDFISKYPNAKLLGVTATPDRTDGTALGIAFNSVAYRYETTDAIRDGWLVPIVPRKAYGLRDFMRLAGERKTIIFTPNVAGAIQIASELPGAKYVHGAMSKTDRTRVVNGFKRGEFQYIANCNVLTEGFDAPDIECVAMLRLTESRSMWMQCLGRGLRLADDKSDCLYVDLTLKMPKHSLEAPRDALGGDYDAVPASSGVVETVWRWFT